MGMAVLTKLSIRHYQSLAEVDLDLAPLTVVVGASSSGKSALIRAIRTLASNTRGSGYVTRGAKRSVITASFDDGLQVELRRGGKTGDGYTLAAPDADSIKFTKIGTSVPEQVSAALAIAPGAELNVAAQFDRPFLLDATGSSVARALGDLTNVAVLYSAAREANRRRLAHSGELTTRRRDLVAVDEQLAAMEGLDAELQRQQALEDEWHSVAELAGRRDRLQQLISAIDQSQQALDALVPVTVPEADYEQLDVLVRTHRAIVERIDQCRAESAALDSLVPVTVPASEAVAAAATAERLFPLLATLTAVRDEMRAVQHAEAEHVVAQDALTSAQVELRGTEDAWRASLDYCRFCGADREHQHPERVHA